MPDGRTLYFTNPGQPSFDEEVAQGNSTIENPLGAQEPTFTVIRQTYIQRASFYKRPTENARCPSDISRKIAYFCDDSPRTPIGISDVVTWERTWATKPASYSDYTNISVVYPGYGKWQGSIFTTPPGYIVIGSRSEFENSPRCRIDYDFYLIGTGGDYSSADSIPVQNENTCTYPTQDAQFPGSIFRLLRGGFFLANGDTVNTFATNPSLTTYQGWVTTDSGTANSYSLIPEQSSQERFFGNIYRRTILRVKAR